MKKVFAYFDRNDDIYNLFVWYLQGLIGGILIRLLPGNSPMTVGEIFILFPMGGAITLGAGLSFWLVNFIKFTPTI